MTHFTNLYQQYRLLLLSCILLSSLSVSASTDYEELDQFESMNRMFFAFNDNADRYLLKPVAKAYRYVSPSFVDEGVTNFFQNIGDVETIANSILQAKFHNAIVALNRVIYNTVFGIGGLFDVATGFGLVSHDEDFGQTLAHWGYENSSYLVLPLLGPSTFRDLGGRVVDTVFDPLQYSEEVDSTDILIAKGVKIVDLRSDILGSDNLLLGEDRYRFLRSAYYQNRDFLINDGVVEDAFSDDDFDYDDF